MSEAELRGGRFKHRICLRDTARAKRKPGDAFIISSQLQIYLDFVATETYIIIIFDIAQKTQWESE